MKNLKISLIFCLVLASIFIQAQTVTVNPNEYDGALSNPLKGFRPSFRGTNSIDFDEYKYPTLVRHYIYWNDIEDNADDGVKKIIDFCNATWAGCEDANVKIIPRVILQYGDAEYYWPSDLPEGDYGDPRLKQRVRNMIAKLGEAWNNDPRVAWVQTGIIGKWGEQESPVGVDEDGWLELLADEYLDHLPNKTLVVRNQNYWTDAGYDMMGAYWDSFGHTGQYNGSWTRILEHNKNGRYLVAPIEGEVAYNWGDGRDNYGYTPTETVSTPSYYNFIVNTTRQLHTAANGWISGYDQNSSTDLGAELIQKAFGYRYVIEDFEVSVRTEPGGSLNFTAEITNAGSAPTYENWPIAFVLVDESSRQIVLQQEISGVNIRDWHPGSDYDWDPISNANGSKVYLNPAKKNIVSASVAVPSGFTAGEYLAGITIIDPSTQKPGVFFAVENFFKESQAQPLCRIGISVDPSNTSLSGVSFDDPLNDDNRYYTLTPTEDTTAPIITLTGDSTIELTIGETYSEQGATANDNVDGDLTSSIAITSNLDTDTVGTYTVNYNVSDAEGNDADEVTRTIRVTEVITPDITVPVITLTGDSTIDLTVGETYSELGATASDNVDGDLTSSIAVTGNVDTSIAGTYTVNYSVSDAAGNAADEVTRTIVVSTSMLENQLPTASFSGITDGQTVAFNSSVEPIVNASDADGAVANVRLYINNQFIRQENVEPYEWGHTANQDVLLKNLEPGIYQLKAEVKDNNDGITTIFLDFTVDNGTSSIQDANLASIQDAFLDNNKRDNTNIVRVEHNRRVAYLMFDVSQFKGIVSDAVLQFEVTSDPGNGNVDVYLGNANNWTENNLDSSNKPALGTLLGSLDSSYPIGSLKEIELTDLSIITGDRLSLVLVATNGNDFAFASKENGALSAPTLKYSVSLNSSAAKASVDNLKVYPNPSSDIITLSKVDHKNTQLSVYDIHGKVMLQEVVTPTSKSIEVSALPPGVYFIFLNGKQWAKFIRQ